MGEAQQPTTGRFRQSRRRICRAEIRRTEGVEASALCREKRNTQDNDYYIMHDLEPATPHSAQGSSRCRRVEGPLAEPPALRLCGHEYPLLLLLTGPFSSPTDHHRSCCLRYQLSGCCNGSYRKDLAPNVDPAFRRRYFRRRRSTRPELYAMNTRRSTRPLCLVWRLPRRGGVLGICSTWQCHSTSLLSLPRLASSR